MLQSCDSLSEKDVNGHCGREDHCRLLIEYLVRFVEEKPTGRRKSRKTALPGLCTALALHMCNGCAGAGTGYVCGNRNVEDMLSDAHLQDGDSQFRWK